MTSLIFGAGWIGALGLQAMLAGPVGKAGSAKRGPRMRGRLSVQ